MHDECLPPVLILDVIALILCVITGIYSFSRLAFPEQRSRQWVSTDLHPRRPRVPDTDAQMDGVLRL